MNLSKLALAALFGATSLVASTLEPSLEASIQERFDAITVDHGGLFETLDPNDYRHPFERRVVTELMKDEKIRALMPAALEMADKVNKEYHLQHMVQGVLVSETQYPKIFQMANENADALHMKKGFRIYVMNSSQMNAYTWSIDQDNYGVALYSGIIEALSDDELQYVLAHEMGHVKSQHILATILMQLYHEKYEDLPPALAMFAPDGDGDDDNDEQEKKEVSASALSLTCSAHGGFSDDLTRSVTGRLRPLMITEEQEAAFKLLQQAAEYSSDRAGMVWANDKEKGMKGLVKLATGHVGGLDGFNLDAYIAQVEALIDSMSDEDLDRMIAGEGGHAFTLMRVAEVGRFFESDEYQDAANTQDHSVYVRATGAYHQVSTEFQRAQAALDEFLENVQGRAEMNALKRRKLERKLNAAVAPYRAPEEALRGLLVDACGEHGLGLSGGPFDLFVAYVTARSATEGFRPVIDALREKVTFLLADEDLPPAQHAELEAKLATLKKLVDGEDEEGEGEEG